MDLFDYLEESKKLKEEGMRKALIPQELSDWKIQFRQRAWQLAQTGQRFTSEDIIETVGLPTGDIGINANNAVGAMMNALAKRNIIKKTNERRNSRRPNSHGAELTVWIGASFNEGE